MTCKHCIHYEVGCSNLSDFSEERIEKVGCSDFKDKSKIIELPCEVSSEVYRNSPTGFVYSWEVAKITIYPDEIIFEDDCGNEFSIDDIGKTVFLTREEAEKALEDMK